MTWTTFSANDRKNTISLKDVKHHEWHVLAARFVINHFVLVYKTTTDRLHENPTSQGFYDNSSLQEYKSIIVFSHIVSTNPVIRDL